MINTCHYTFVCIHRISTPRVNPKVNYELCINVMCPHRFLSCNKGTTLVADAKGESTHPWGKEVYGKSLYIPLNRATDLKPL